MQNPICIPKNKLRALYVYDMRERTASWMLKFLNHFWPIEMHKQLEEESGEFYDYSQFEIKKFTKKTENAEILTSLELSDFYFGSEVNTDICFEIKRRISIKNLKTYKDLTDGIESNTHVDCFISKDGQGLEFQIKRYPQERLALNTDSFVKFIEEKNRRYGAMQKTILAILIQPIPFSPLHIIFFKTVHELLVGKGSINFAEVVLLYNDKNKNMVIRRVFPDYIAASKPIEFKSAKYKQLQEDS